ncbi:MAG: LamG-like jellyroll fold domain-containing protein [Nanoarchaeota archaeon]
MKKDRVFVSFAAGVLLIIGIFAIMNMPNADLVGKAFSSTAISSKIFSMDFEDVHIINARNSDDTNTYSYDCHYGCPDFIQNEDDDYVNFDGSGLLTLGKYSSPFRKRGALTFSFWTKIGGSGGGWVMGSGAQGGHGYGGMYLNKDTFLFSWTPTTPASDRHIRATDLNLPVNGWNHIVFEIDFENKDYALYINGIERVTTLNLPPSNWRQSGQYSTEQYDLIGGRYVNKYYYYTGSLDKIRIFNSYLSEEDIQHLYDSEKIPEYYSLDALRAISNQDSNVPERNPSDYMLNGTDDLLLQSYQHVANTVCGDNIISGKEECETPSILNNQFCPQLTNKCVDGVLYVRDELGNCNPDCYCTHDNYIASCSFDCNNGCVTDSDCADGYYCDTGCSCNLGSCHNGVLDEGEECDTNAIITNNNGFCLAYVICEDCKVKAYIDPYNALGYEIANDGIDNDCNTLIDDESGLLSLSQRFDNQMINMADDVFYNDDVMTISFSTKFQEGEGGYVIGTGSNGGQGYGGVYQNLNTFFFTWTPSSPASDTQISAFNLNLEPNVWHDILFTIDFDNKLSKLYIDGEVVETTISRALTNWKPTGSYSDGTNTLGGRVINGVYNYFKGHISNVNVYNKYLDEPYADIEPDNAPTEIFVPEPLLSATFNGGSYNTKGQLSAFRQDSNITYSYWTKLQEGQEGYAMGTGVHGGQGYGGIYQNLNFTFFTWTPTTPASDTQIITSNLKLEPNLWHHVLFTIDFNSKLSKLYVDGHPTQTSMNRALTNWRPTGRYSDDIDYIGGRRINNVYYSYTGELDKIKIYDQYLTDGQILRIYKDDKISFS